MGIFDAININYRAYGPELRMDVIANIANVNTTRTENGLPTGDRWWYSRKLQE